MPRIALISDVHGNLDALEAVLVDIKGQDVDEIACLGDTVGYGAAPAECLKLVRDSCSATVLGNHDEYLVKDPDNFVLSKRIRDPLILAKETIAPGDLDWLARRPLTAELHGFTIVHGSLHNPEAFNYLLDRFETLLHFEEQKMPLCFVGHSHRPLIAQSLPDDDVTWNKPREMETLLDRNQRYVVNVGSVGQPRDEDPRPTYGIFDADQYSFTLRKVCYDIRRAQERIKEAGLPWENAKRLASGT